MREKLKQYESRTEYKDAIEKSLIERGREHPTESIDRSIKIELLFNEVLAHGLGEIVARIRDVRMGKVLKKPIYLTKKLVEIYNKKFILSDGRVIQVLTDDEIKQLSMQNKNSGEPLLP